MAVWIVYLSLCLLFSMIGAEEIQHQRAARNIFCNNCPAGWAEYGCRCFKFFSPSVTWIAAEKTCLSYGSNLASVHNHEEYMFIQNMIRQQTHTSTRTWIGGNDAVSENSWLWSNGKPMNYQLWAPEQPDNYRGYEHCIEMNYGDSSNWNDLNCFEKFPFVCSKY
ncbi:galactose-specific lectin nattectin-like [Xyrauchen texanus]|uniref:galactose-specific lectin nattectin-like n=1 Tax=Xyrauchen texanus TaxID=154827 RepID=UPI0022425548|nr:galactose-specific lectin nattectin-like [Xyrauchen texanus]XP_051984582.1 galactose-specific lectin nattectin-like [Xyrauchen texanus]XP_051984583.1 galactose-specific lectin nattectin-like [Xyrauchen texanus]XP_051984584.1 galactose-specific lectin nattectin-like [Xyrauchen texanus]XP_051984585.1 galactose-specific lectin nattectin-like [Xyrauchen texanus]